ncbi:MAG: PEP-CTERM sorting domain-containing protein [Colwellia sp.]|nr:PEP-CTERM sorting domain-containing protein [Colwellia sp.]
MFKKITNFNLLNVFILTLASMSYSAQATPIPVDLSTWQSDGAGNWNLQSGNDSVFQSTNGDPTVFFESGSNAQGTQISGSIQVTSSSDDDFIGFVLGYQDNELSSASSEFLLIDWKQQDQNLSSTVIGLDGLAISKVNGAGTFNEFWGHTGPVSEIARATNLGSTGWVDNQAYMFDIVFTSNMVQVYVDSSLEISITAADAGVASFSDGAVGFYNSSQASVLYAGITEQIVTQQPVPEPSTLAIFALGMIGLASRRFKKQSL